jgi:hypothetical protein
MAEEKQKNVYTHKSIKAQHEVHGKAVLRKIGNTKDNNGKS